ncbi:MAG: type I secretion C-terminal target domain-containing protein, partial [Verrucomicrobiales bacterium]|nr:type I secretion C-terminal target domain-containing protein [Verrucomicrobiales bacterium]
MPSILLVVWMLAVASISAQSATLTAPPTVVFGRILHMGEGPSYQVHSGQMSLELVREDDPSHVIALTTRLARIGPAGEVSYRLEIPVKYLPASHELRGSLAAGFQKTHYRFRGITIDGHQAVPTDPDSLRVTATLANHAIEHRLDLEVTLPQIDSDDDGMPDWWELKYGLNAHLADASRDSDGDGLNNLGEFRATTDPTKSNVSPTVQTTTLLVPKEGVAGFHIGIVDLDTPPTALALKFTGIPEGLTLRNGESVIQPGTRVSYAEVLAGQVRINLNGDFASGSLEIVLEDAIGSNAPITHRLRLESFSPASVAGIKPAMWLNVDSLGVDSAVSEWADLSSNDRDAFQPFPALQPVASSAPVHGVRFDRDAFLFLDEGGLTAGSFTAFFAFRSEGMHQDSQTVFHGEQLDLSIGGTADSAYAQSVSVMAAGRSLRGPLVAPGQSQQVTVGSGNAAAYLRVANRGFVSSVHPPEDNSAPPFFSTIGARHLIGNTSAHAFLDGFVQECMIYASEMDPAELTQNEDYLESRWSQLTVWNFHDQTVPIVAKGNRHERNALTGGRDDDYLVGGSVSDTLRGGPGNDHLTGLEGADRFQFFKDQGNDTVTDFDAEAGDVLDLTGIFGALSGSPTDYVKIRRVITRADGALPRADSIIELDYDGIANGWTVSQTITLENCAVASLARLVGEQSLLLGGPQFETRIELTSESPATPRNSVAHQVTVTRTGTLEAALELFLNFTGDARIDVDYTTSLSQPVEARWGESLSVSPKAGPNSVRSLRFARGQAKATFEVVSETSRGDKRLLIAVLADPRVTSVVPSTLELALARRSSLTADELVTPRSGNDSPGRDGNGLDDAGVPDLSGDLPGNSKLSIQFNSGRLELSLVTAGDWPDIPITIERSTDLNVWADVTSEFDVTLIRLGTDLMRRT